MTDLTVGFVWLSLSFWVGKDMNDVGLIFSWGNLVNNFFKPYISHIILDSRHLVRQRIPHPSPPCETKSDWQSKGM